MFHLYFQQSTFHRDCFSCIFFLIQFTFPFFYCNVSKLYESIPILKMIRLSRRPCDRKRVLQKECILKFGGKIYVFSDLLLNQERQKLISVDKVSQLLYIFLKKKKTTFFFKSLVLKQNTSKGGKWDGERNQITTSSLRDLCSLNIRRALFTFSFNFTYREPTRQTNTNSKSLLKMHFHERVHFRCKSSYFHPTKGGDVGVTPFQMSRTAHLVTLNCDSAVGQ